ncbi:DnaJ (Hsp40), sub C, member 17 [Podila epigama]|nr:DnaJ (Hsp40), sub C, member 17 [Podila epigama]
MAEERLDWYAILGVERNATSKEITKAYRLKALKVHPDKNPDPNAAKIFHELSQAYDILLDPAARAAFDNLLNVKVQAKARTEKYDATRKKFMDDLVSREEAFKKQQEDEKAAAIRMKYEMARIEQENIKKREAKEAELRRQAEQIQEVTAMARQAAVDAEATSLDTTLRVKWKKKKNEYDQNELRSIFQKFGPIDSCLSKKQGSALVSFTTLTGAIAAMKAFETNSQDLDGFTLSWASGNAPSTDSIKELNGSIKSTVGPSSEPVLTSSSTTKPAFSTPASSTPAFGSASSFGGFPFEIKSLGPTLNFMDAPSAPFSDDYEAATLARMRNKDIERKRLAEEILRKDQEEAEEEQARMASQADKRQKK